MLKFSVARGALGSDFRARLIVYTSADQAQDLAPGEFFRSRWRRIELDDDRIATRNAFFS
jgi:hypothetical protein